METVWTLAACRERGETRRIEQCPTDPGDCEAVSRRAAALLLNFMVP